VTARQPWTRRVTSAAAGTIALLMVGGVAYAAWSAHGAGTSAAATGTPETLGVSATVAGQLYPGASADVLVTIGNPNTLPVTVTALALDGTIAASAGCTTPGVAVSLPASLSLVVPAGDSLPLSITGGVAMTTASSSDCQGATFTIPLRATGRLP
jgi:hypothetical protein